MEKPQIIKIIKDIVGFADKTKLEYFFGGGIALMIQSGDFYRDNEDIDFYPKETDMHLWKPLFRKLGYTLVLHEDFDDYPYAFVGKSDNLIDIEVFPVKYLNTVIIGYWRAQEYGEFFDKKKLDIIEVDFQGLKVKVEKYESVLNQKRIEGKDGKIREKDLVDFKKFNQEYTN